MKAWLACFNKRYIDSYRNYDDFIADDDIHIVKEIRISKQTAKMFSIGKFKYSKITSRYSFHETRKESQTALIEYLEKYMQNIIDKSKVLKREVKEVESKLTKLKKVVQNE